MDFQAAADAAEVTSHGAHQADAGLEFDPLTSGRIWQGTCRWQYSAERPYGVRVVELEVGDVIVAAGIRVQAVPYSMEARGATMRKVAPLVTADAGCQAVPIGTVIVEDLRTGEREIVSPDQHLECDDSSYMEMAWTTAQQLELADALRGNPERRFEAFARYQRAIDGGGDTADIAHVHLAEWQSQGDWSLPTKHTSQPAPANPQREIAAHLGAGVRGGGAVREQAARIAIERARNAGWSKPSTDLLSALARAAADSGDPEWGTALLCRVAPELAASDRTIAREWVNAGLRSASAPTRGLALKACRELIDISSKAGDTVTLDRLQGAVEASTTLTDEERVQLSSAVGHADQGVRDADLDAVLATMPERIGNSWDALRATDIATLVGAGGRWRDGIARTAINALTQRIATKGDVREIRAALDAAIAAADAAGAAVAADAYGVAWAQALGTYAGMGAFGYAMRGLASAHPGVRSASVPVMRTVIDSGRLRIDETALSSQLAAIGTVEADAVLQLLRAPQLVEAGVVATTLAGRGARTTELTGTATTHVHPGTVAAASWQDSKSVLESVDPSERRVQPGYLDRFPGQNPAADDNSDTRRS